MKFFILFACFAVFVTANEDAWKNFKTKYGKSYKNVMEEKVRYKNFQNNLKEIEEHNKLYDQGLVTYTKGINHLADKSKEEFRRSLKYRQQKSGNIYERVYKPAGPIKETSIDWRTKGAVTPVKDEGTCEGCWSFSATGSLEGQNQIINGKLISLSEQNIIDCSKSYGNNGCDGGFTDFAMDYVKDNGINSEESYPYDNQDGECRFDPDNIVLKISNYTKIPKDDEDALISAIETIGPISVAIDASENFQFYKSGIFDDPACDGELNHGVVAVGFDEESILLKNAWTTEWGEEGYIRFKRGTNLCRVASSALYPEL